MPNQTVSSDPTFLGFLKWSTTFSSYSRVWILCAATWAFRTARTFGNVVALRIKCLSNAAMAWCCLLRTELMKLIETIDARYFQEINIENQTTSQLVLLLGLLFESPPQTFIFTSFHVAATFISVMWIDVTHVSFTWKYMRVWLRWFKQFARRSLVTCQQNQSEHKEEFGCFLFHQSEAFGEF